MNHQPFDIPESFANLSAYRPVCTCRLKDPEPQFKVGDILFYKHPREDSGSYLQVLQGSVPPQTSYGLPVYNLMLLSNVADILSAGRVFHRKVVDVEESYTLVVSGSQSTQVFNKSGEAVVGTRECQELPAVSGGPVP